jgi:hypothetical protein
MPADLQSAGQRSHDSPVPWTPARVQHELAEVRAEQDTRARTGQSSAPQRHYDAAGLTAGELERTRRELAASLALARPGSPARAPIQAQMAAIDAELSRATHSPPERCQAPVTRRSP